MSPRTESYRKWAILAGFAALATGVSVYASISSDKQIKSSAEESHVFRTYLKEDKINVDARNGVVTLSGTVSSASHKSLAQQTLEEMSGVKSVTNNLKVDGEDLDEMSDGWIGTKVKAMLMFRRHVNGRKTGVKVKDGVVTLSGEADSLAQKEFSAEYAKDVDGVKRVENEMAVKSPVFNREVLTEKIDDASITAQVKMVLLYHRSTSALKTSVKTSDGLVRLSGNALNAAEKDLAGKLTKEIRGVKDVRNDMTVAPGTKG